MWNNSPSGNAVDENSIAFGWSALHSLSATAVSKGTVWRYGVADSIGGFEPLDPGSNPGTSAGSCPMGHGVMESMLGCGPFDPGSTPGAPAISTHGGAKTQPRTNMETKKPKKTNENRT